MKTGTVKFMVEYAPDVNSNCNLFINELKLEPDAHCVNEFKKLIKNFE